MFKNKLVGIFLNQQRSTLFYQQSLKLNYFTGKTETGFKFTTPKLRMKSVKPIFPPPGHNLEIPSNLKIKIGWTPKFFCERIGGDCHEIADKFENINEIFQSKTEALKTKGVPVKQRKYLLRVVDNLRRGVLTFEYLQRRTTIKPCRKLTISQAAAKGAKKDDKKDKK